MTTAIGGKWFNSRTMRFEPTRQATDDELLAAYDSWTRSAVFERGDLVEPKPELGNIHDSIGNRWVFIEAMDRRLIDPEATPMHVAFGLQVDCLVGYINPAGDWAIVSMDSRRLRVATSS